ncbi:MAG: DUF87 domain-containing protein [Acidobacteriota bacterium]
MATTTPSQPIRLLILILYLAALFFASKVALGSWLPPSTEKGLWFYSGIAALLLGNLLVTPFYHKPADAISYAVAAGIGLLAVNLPSQHQYTSFDRSLWLTATCYIGVVLVASVLSIALKDSSRSSLKKSSESLRLVADAIGGPKAVFSAVFLFALVTFHRDVPREYLIIGLAWAVIVTIQPLEALSILLKRLWRLWRNGPAAQEVGEVVGHQIPSVVLIRQQIDSSVVFGDLVVVRGDSGEPGLAMILDQVGFAEGAWIRAFHLPIPAPVRDLIQRSSSVSDESKGLATQIDLADSSRRQITDGAWTGKDRLVGLVTQDTDISRLRVELVRTDLDLEEGRLVEVNIGPNKVLYQIINGLTREEIVQQKNKRGYVRGEAKKIGRWRDELRRFEAVRWIPQPNAPVFLVEPESPDADRSAIGHFPGTSYPVSVDVHSLVTHNAAILGILGAGKSFLALELVERMIDAGVKVICLDLTNQYAKELSPYYDADARRPAIEKLQAIGAAGKTLVNQNVEEGGSINTFSLAVRTVLKGFLKENEACRLLMFNPTEFEVWRQDSRPFKDNASMASLTPTEITRIFAESALEVLQAQGMTDVAKCCLVLEEAHSLIPEWNSVASEGDKVATNGTAKAILQGRKYGLGCLVVTQRTANVTKSILNQCNTVFALRVFDATGMDFLKNYVGEEYAGVLSTLEDRHAVAFGRASSCSNPVLIRLNDRKDFLSVFRGKGAANADGVRAESDPGNVPSVSVDITEGVKEGSQTEEAET